MPVMNYDPKQLMKIYLLIFSLFVNTLAKAGETNVLYPTEDEEYGHAVRSNQPAAAKARYDVLWEAAKKTRESLPAIDFPEGNWGVVTNGCQLSLRFVKPVYTNGEPVTVILLLRNFTNKEKKQEYCRYRGHLDGPAHFRIVSKSGEVIAEKQPPGEVVDSNMFSDLPFPGMQHRYVQHMNKGYDFTNGEYLVQASIPIQNVEHVNGKSVFQWEEVKSATVSIKIEASKDQ
jgi:hypothetical protein